MRAAVRESAAWAHTMAPRFHAHALLLALLAPAVAAQGGLSGTLLVVNRTGGSISLFDLATRV